MITRGIPHVSTVFGRSSSIFSSKLRLLAATSVANLLLPSPAQWAQSFSNSACSLSACCFKEASAPCDTIRLMVDDGCNRFGSMMHQVFKLWIEFQCDFSSCLKIFQDFFQFQDSSRCFTTFPRKSANLPQPSVGPPGHLRLSAVARLVGRIGLRDRPTRGVTEDLQICEQII